jgi:diguanylate cyclase (GGDEF)-like protein/putative nucleotidyltransferase with HDIG domain
LAPNDKNRIFEYFARAAFWNSRCQKGRMPVKARIYVGLVIVLGLISLFHGISPFGGPRGGESGSILRFVVYLVVAVIGSGFKISLPRIEGTLSFYFLFVLVGVVQLSLPETLAIAGAAVVWQCYWRAKSRPATVQVAFNLASNFIAVHLAYSVLHSTLWEALSAGAAVRLGATAVVFFAANTAPVAAVIAFTEGKKMNEVWDASYLWSFPYYMTGASVAGFFNWLTVKAGWDVALLIVPVIAVLFRGYRLHLGQLESMHAEEIESLHMRTIEALAMAIDAKDQTTHDHVQRVQIYALEVGKQLGLGKNDLDALRAAALLHDIGKLAVPEHIICKPGKLTSEEFEKIKIHPIVGSEILERIRFPYPVAPIVRAHHEKWDGSGYPAGLRGQEIPIGARILSAVDCLDALASDRQYRRAYPLDVAMKMVADQAGTSFDPKIVAILQRRYIEMEAMTRGADLPDLARLSTAVSVERGAAPDAGFEDAGFEEEAAAVAKPVSPTSPANFLRPIAAAGQEMQTLFEMALDMGNSLSLPETLSVLVTRLERLVQFDTFALYALRNGTLVPEYVAGEDRTLLGLLKIPLGQGLSGWVAQNSKPIVNGNPSVEPGYTSDSTKPAKLKSALAVPLEDGAGVVGVLSLYRAEANAFNRDQLRIVQAMASKLAVALHNGLMFRQAEASATTDYLTGLPNTRSLFTHLDQELSQAGQTRGALSVIVGDLDGFKNVNDHFGHLAGNELLRQIAAALKSCCFDGGYVARMGGDEFVVVLRGVASESLEVKKSQICRAVESAGAELCGEHVVSLSVGQAQYPQDGRTVEDLLAAADKRMYENKRRNKAAYRTGSAVAGVLRDFALVA